MRRSTILVTAMTALAVLIVVLVVRTDDEVAHGTRVDLEDAPSAPTSLPAESIASPDPRSDATRSREPDARAVVAADRRDDADLDRAVAFLRALLPGRFASLTIEEARALTTLDLGGARLRDGDLAHLAALPALEGVSLRGSDVTDAALADLRAVTNLASVDLRDTKTTELGVVALPTDRLRALHLTDSTVDVRDVRWLPAMPQLEVFKLNGLALNDAALADLDFLPALRHVEIDRTAITDEGLRRFLARNPSVQRVELRETKVSAAVIAELTQSHPGLELVDGRDVAMIVR